MSYELCFVMQKVCKNVLKTLCHLIKINVQYSIINFQYSMIFVEALSIDY